MKKFDTLLIREMIRGAARSYNDCHPDRPATTAIIEGITKRAARMIYREVVKRVPEVKDAGVV